MPVNPNAKITYHSQRFNVCSIERQGKRGALVEREYISHPGAVVILPVYNESNIILIRNDRYAVNEILWELPAGTLEIGEAPEQAAARELIEETGYQAGEIEPLTSFYTTPGFCNENMFAYAAKHLTFVGQQLDDTENITVEIVTWKDAIKKIQTGSIRDGKTIAILLFYDKYFRSK